MHTEHRTGIRFVLSNNTEPGRENDFHDWYDLYAQNVLFLGLLVNCSRFENPLATGTDDDPRYVAIYDFVCSNLSTAWSRVEESVYYPNQLFRDARRDLVTAPLRATYRLERSIGAGGENTKPSGLTILLSDGALSPAREQWAARLLDTGLFYAASQFSVVEGEPQPPASLEVFETAHTDPLNVFRSALDRIGEPPAGGRERYRGSFRFYSKLHPPRAIGKYGDASDVVPHR